MTRVGIIFGNETIEISLPNNGNLYRELAYVAWDKLNQEIVSLGIDAKNLNSNLNDNNNEVEVIKLFDNNKITNFEILEKAFHKIFDPLKNELKDQELIVGYPTDLSNDDQIKIEQLFATLEPKELVLIPNIFLLALGNGCDVSDEYGTIVLNFGYSRTSLAIIADNKVVNFKTVPVGEDDLDSALSLFFKERHQLILSCGELYRIKYELASLTTNSYGMQLLISGEDLLTNQSKKVLLKESDIHKIFTSLFSNYRSAITRLLEESPTRIRTGVTKNGLLVTGKMNQIYGVLDYFTGFFEFPTLIIDEKINKNDALYGATSINLTQINPN